MPVELVSSGAQTTAATNNEYTLASITTPGVFLLQVDLATLTAGQVMELRGYKMVLTGGTARVQSYDIFYATQLFPVVTLDTIANTLSDSTAVKFTMTQLWGAAALVPWAVLNLEAPPQIQKNVALSSFEFVMRSSTTHLPVTGLTVTATRSIDGAAFGACANSVSELANGVYTINLAAADLNGRVITFKATATGADDTLLTIVTNG